jgi:hypothetical protein
VLLSVAVLLYVITFNPYRASICYYLQPLSSIDIYHDAYLVPVF